MAWLETRYVDVNNILIQSRTDQTLETFLLRLWLDYIIALETSDKVKWMQEKKARLPSPAMIG